ncbi:thioredoxin family protein [Solitalea lacus]|uniref:thioredoxin family protein n=1 Tax=Solitalea lacus TaxID=2911172 RepID=UPI001EDABDFE|nr:thioredoxin family protein [Solitalea lacus]UKJ06778.1 thioredoxin family protein [Solitalea lacus]
MKKIFSLLFLLISANTLFAQEGIIFDHGTWKEILTKAKQENKLVFVDVYTSWCGPCKKMVAEVFPKKEVGDVFNASFINYKIDAEKGEGMQIAKEFGVKSYPTYLFVNGDGGLVYRSGGYNEAKKFLQEATIALKEKKDPKPLAKWEDEYDAGQRSKEFLLGYLKKRATLKAPSAEVIEVLVPQLTPADLLSQEFLTSVIYSNENIAYVPKGKFFNYVINHHDEIDALLAKNKNYSLRVLDNGIQQYFISDIIAKNKEGMLPVMEAAKKQVMGLLKADDIETISKRLRMDYYKGTHNSQKLIPAALDYVNNGLMKTDIAGMIAADVADYQKFRQPYLDGKADSSKVEQWHTMNRIMANQRVCNFSYNLREAAEAIYHNVEDKKVLAQAAEWAKKAATYFPHFSNEAVYAGLLLKCEKKQEAIEMMKKASEDNIIKGKDQQKMILSNIEKAEKGEMPEKLWKL